MGEVYRARDSKLKRDVAIKVLPDAFARDPERLARFEREAEVLATLNHPNIAQIYGLEGQDGRDGRALALVMEFVDGPTLAERVAQSAIAVEDALPIARQIADALEAAHERGIVHRDLKPANIKLTADGQVKVLDFGLAKMRDGDVSDPRQANITASPTMMSPAMTGLGTVLGTAAYMSPEQAAAKPTDKRADIWSFGVILWEMLTGLRLFEAETVSHTLADVLRAPIDLTKLPATTPPAVHELIGRCLERDVKNRLRDIGEARVAIDRARAGQTSSVAPAPQRGWRSAVVAASATAALAMTAAAAIGFVHFREQPPAAPLMQFQIQPPSLLDGGMVLSPDGRKLAFVALGPDNRRHLWLREMDGLTARMLPGTEFTVRGVFWSPDSQSIGFGVEAGALGTLKRIDVNTGAIQTVCGYSGGFRGGAWNRDGIMVFGGGSFGVNAGLMRVPQSGGDPTPVTSMDLSHGETNHVLPVFLPDGRRFLYFRASFTAETQGVYVASLDVPAGQQSSSRLIAANAGLGFVANAGSGGGWVLFLRDGSLFAQAIDASARPVGESRLLSDSVGNNGNYGWFSASQTGTLTHRAGAAGLPVELRWVDRQGKPLGTLSPGGDEAGGGLQISPDGKRVIVTLADVRAGARGLSGTQAACTWIAETNRGVFSRLTSEQDGTESSPAISPDGHVIFSSTLNGAVGDLYRTDGTGIGRPEPLLVKSVTVKHPNHVSPDGRFLMFDDHSLQQRQDLWVLPLDGPAGAARKPIPFLVTAADETFGQFSPDGKWVAYSSDESGRREVYVQGFAPDHVPAAAIGKWPISTAGGDKPRWRHDGRELYYLSSDSKLMAVPIKSGPSSFEPGLAVPLFAARVTGFFPYDVAPDGRFLLQVAADSAPGSVSPVTVVLNWQAALKK